MRLRYLHLPRCGPLFDTVIVFGREELIEQALSLPRKGALNFVVGINGSGKSSILRALYQIFRDLKDNNLPKLPVTLAWDIFVHRAIETAVLHIPAKADEKPWFVVTEAPSSEIGKSGWEHYIDQLKNSDNHLGLGERTKRGDDVMGAFLQTYLPKRLIAYTSGAEDLWSRLEQTTFTQKTEEEGQYQPEDERPPGWSMDQEWAVEQPMRVASALARYEKNLGSYPGMGQIAQLAGETSAQLKRELEPLETLREKIYMNRQPREARLDDFYLRIHSRHLRFTGIILALWQTAKELGELRTETSREDVRKRFIKRLGSLDESPQDGRRVLNEIDWFWPTHLSLIYCDTDDLVTARQHQELLCLVALADEVIALPRGRKRAIISLGSTDQVNLSEKLKSAFPLVLSSKMIEDIAARVDNSKTGAEAVLRIFSADKNIDSTPMDVFSRLRDWERTGLLEETTMTIKRLHSHEAADGEPDDTIVTYDQLSDGEQMLLGRMGLFFLLRGQEGSLLLMDEPETHFNDVWKREIVEMIDMGLLNSTKANVIVATHTSIALTDAFAAEVTVLDKHDGETSARAVMGGLFGTDPGEVNMNLFRADSSIGRRSEEILDRLLKTEWKGRENELEAILNVLGSSFHRAELRAILKQLRTNPNGASSS